MTRNEIEALSGDALRVAVANRVFGLGWVPCHGGFGYWSDGEGVHRSAVSADKNRAQLLAPYESDIAAAFEVVEHLFSSGILPRKDIHIEHFDEPPTWNVSTCQTDGMWGAWTDHESLPVAICRAALFAVEREDG